MLTRRIGHNSSLGRTGRCLVSALALFAAAGSLAALGACETTVTEYRECRNGTWYEERDVRIKLDPKIPKISVPGLEVDPTVNVPPQPERPPIEILRDPDGKRYLHVPGSEEIYPISNPPPPTLTPAPSEPLPRTSNDCTAPRDGSWSDRLVDYDHTAGFVTIWFGDETPPNLSTPAAHYQLVVDATHGNGVMVDSVGLSAMMLLTNRSEFDASHFGTTGELIFVHFTNLVSGRDRTIPFFKTIDPYSGTVYLPVTTWE